MHIHVRIHHWVLWWSCLGVVCGIVALVNILGRNLTPTQENAVLVVGAFFWLLVGLACYAYEGVKVETLAKPQAHSLSHPNFSSQQREWHYASEFLLPGNRKRLLPPKH